MPKFAYYDPTMEQPAPVLGWYDTDLFDYGANLPDPSQLLALSQDEWVARGSTPCVTGGKLAPWPPAETWPPNP